MPSISDTDLQRRARPCGCSAHHPVCTPRPDDVLSSRVTNLMYLSRAKGRPHGPRVFTRTPTEAALVYECRRAGTARSRVRGRGTSKRELIISLHLQWTLTHPRLHQHTNPRTPRGAGEAGYVGIFLLRPCCIFAVVLLTPELPQVQCTQASHPPHRSPLRHP